MDLDSIDVKILEVMQSDVSLSNQMLADRVGVSPPTCLRRVKRLVEGGLIERQIAVLDSGKLAEIQGHGLTVIVEVTLDNQADDRQQAFEARVVHDSAVQQCYRVSPGPDFVLIVYVADMPGYQAFAQRLLGSDANVRNVKAYFSMRRAKFEPGVPIQLC